MSADEINGVAGIIIIAFGVTIFLILWGVARCLNNLANRLDEQAKALKDKRLNS